MDAFDRYSPRGLECVCGNLRMAARAVSGIYDRHLKPVGLQASQMAVLWAVAGRKSESVKAIARVIAMDETTLLRNLRVLERRGLVTMRHAYAFVCKGEGSRGQRAAGRGDRHAADAPAPSNPLRG